jgi:anti-sigma regulatory factor (Ser/Thr protein kinase)
MSLKTQGLGSQPGWSCAVGTALRGLRNPNPLKTNGAAQRRVGTAPRLLWQRKRLKMRARVLHSRHPKAQILTTLPTTPDPGMELRDLLADREFLGRRDNAKRASRRFEALQVLASVFVEPPNVLLQKLVDVAVEFCGADSAGISLEESDERGELRFRWVAISGTFSKYIQGTTPRFFSPCGTCLSSGRPQHYRVTKPYYDFLGVTADDITDGMLIPWISDESRGTIWAISHSSFATFTPDDYKLLSTLAEFVGISVRLAERALQMNLCQLERNAKPADKKILADSQELLDHCVVETRTISHLLHPPLLNESGLRSAAQWYVEGFSERSGIEVALEIDDNLGRMQEGVETALFRALQESLNNVHRHSGSKKVDVGIRLDGANAMVTIRDYGCGFSTQQLRDVNNSRSRGVGLTGLRERIAALGGSFEVLPAQPGAVIQVRLPYNQGAKGATS